MIQRLLISISQISATLIVVIGLLWLLLARPGISFKDVSRVSHRSVNPILLKKHTLTLSEDLAPRNYRNTDNLNRAANYIAESLKSSGARVNEQVFEVNGTEYKNVIAEYGPQDQELIIVGAHYDVDGENPGADDNASGIAGLLEMGRLLGEVQLKTRVVLVAFTLEEPPFFRSENMGSAVYAKSLAKSDTRVKLMIALEMIGYFSDQKGSQDYPMPLLDLFYPTTGNYIAVVDKMLSTQAQRMKKSMTQVIDFPVYSINAPLFIPGVDFSDHRNFWAYGYPAVMVTDTAFYRNHAYHTEYDRAERLDYDKMAQVVAGVFDYVLKLTSA